MRRRGPLRVIGWGPIPLPGERRRLRGAEAEVARRRELIGNRLQPDLSPSSSPATVVDLDSGAVELEATTAAEEVGDHGGTRTHSSSSEVGADPLPVTRTVADHLPLQAGAEEAEHYRVLRSALGVEIPEDLLTVALTHRSYAYENGGLPTNERLEFLGDAVLSVVVTERLYRDHPDLPEGQLAKLRASVVNMHALAGVAAGLGPEGLGAYLYLGRGEELTGGRSKASTLADATEALIGAVYLQHGLETARTVVHHLFDALLGAAPLLGAGLDWKTSLQELTAAADLGVPEYRISEGGPEQPKVFEATVTVSGRQVGVADGRTKKEAEQKAAEAAWRVLTSELSNNPGHFGVQ